MKGTAPMEVVIHDLHPRLGRPNEQFKLKIPQWNEELAQWVLDNYLLPLF